MSLAHPNNLGCNISLALISELHSPGKVLKLFGHRKKKEKSSHCFNFNLERPIEASRCVQVWNGNSKLECSLTIVRGRRRRDTGASGALRPRRFGERYGQHFCFPIHRASRPLASDITVVGTCTRKRKAF